MHRRVGTRPHQGHELTEQIHRECGQFRLGHRRDVHIGDLAVVGMDVDGSRAGHAGAPWLRRNERIGNGDLLVYTGDASPLLRLMTVVQQRRLMVGDSFENKDTLRMRIAEEANLANKEISTVRSDTMQLVVVGVDFYVKANNTERRGWVVSSAICRNGDGEMPNNAATQKIRYLGRQCDTNTIDLSRSDDDDDDDGGMYHVSAVMYVLLCNMSALTILSCTVVCSLTVLT